MLCSIEAYLFKKIYFGLIEVHQLKCKPYLHQKVSLEKIEIFFFFSSESLVKYEFSK